MTLTILAVTLILVGTLLIIKAFRSFSKREKSFEKIVVPPAYYPPLPQMVGLSQQIEQAAADETARKLCEDIEYDLYRGADASNTPPTPPKRKRAPKGMRKTEIPGVYVAKESTSIFAPPKVKSKKKAKKNKGSKR